MIEHASLGILCRFHSATFGIASWVDNLYALGGSADEAVRSLERFESLLKCRWRQRIKPKSCFVFSQRRREQGTDCRGYVWSSPFCVLGCKIGPSGHCWIDFEEASAAVWRRMWAGPRSKAARKLPLRLKIRDIERCCWPSLFYRCSWWPISTTMLGKLESLQNAVVACVLRIPMQAGEEAGEFHRRRGREARRCIKRSDSWRLKVCRRTSSWKDHLERGHVWSWAVEISACRDDLWLQSQRMLNSSASMFAGVLGCRDSPGRPFTRWQESMYLVAAELAKPF